MKQSTGTWSSSYTGLCEFMARNVNEEDSIDVWNDVRNRAKEQFTSEVISRLDASGYIKEFYLFPSEDRMFYAEHHG